MGSQSSPNSWIPTTPNPKQPSNYEFVGRNPIGNSIGATPPLMQQEQEMKVDGGMIEDAKKPQAVKKKRGYRARIMLDDIFEKKSKPKTPKQAKQKRAPAPRKKASTPRRKKLNELSNIQGAATPIEHPPIHKDFPETCSSAKRVLNFDLNCQPKEFGIQDDVTYETEENNRLMQANESIPRHGFLIGECQSLIPKGCKKIRTSIRIANAKKKRLLPTKMVVDDAFKCIMSLTHQFVVTTTRKRKRRVKHIKQCVETAIFVDRDSSHSSTITDHEEPPKSQEKTVDLMIENVDSPKEVNTGASIAHTKTSELANTDGFDHSANTKSKTVTKRRKKQDSPKNKQAKDTSGSKTVTLEKMLDSITKKLEDLCISENALVPYEYKKMKMEVDIDEETSRVWNLLKEREEDFDPINEADEEKKKWWEEQRRTLAQKAALFIVQLRVILGDRTFSPWKGSVLDSVVGVYLTQNVFDNLSSSAFMSLVARYPVKLPRENVSNEECCETLDHHVTNNQGSSIDKEAQSATDASRDAGANTINTIHLSNQTSQKKKEVKSAEKINWDSLRTTYSKQDNGKNRCPNAMDSVDWDAVRKADVKEVADAIKERGQQNIIAQKIQDCLNRIVNDHGSLDLEWLREVPQDKAKEYLLDIHGLGLKSVECLRLLTLHHHAFPVDVNVARIAIRLGWVPLRPLPDSVYIHLLKKYPNFDKIQAYLWSRLYHLRTELLYELHYLMITFGKVFCTERKPHCSACPLRGDCKYYASACASSKLALPQSKPKSNKKSPKKGSHSAVLPLDYPVNEIRLASDSCEPIIEEPPSPKPEHEPYIERDIEDFGLEDPNEMLYLDLTTKLFDNKVDKDMLKAMVTLSPNAPSNPIPQKQTTRLSTEHHVYELPDDHPLLKGFDKREPNDPNFYLLAIWPEEANEGKHTCKEDESDDNTCSSSSCNCREEHNLTVPGTLLIPCRTAMRGSFPLNGTYFQMNEVFVDIESSKNPINVPRSLIWNLKKRILYCGASAATILREHSAEPIQECFLKGYLCVRGVNRVTKAPQRLPNKFHKSKSTPKNKNAEQVE